jgi:hypothetical protein
MARGQTKTPSTEVVRAFLPDASAKSWSKLPSASRISPDDVVTVDKFAHQIGLAVEAQVLKRLSGIEILIVDSAGSRQPSGWADFDQGTLPGKWLSVPRADVRVAPGRASDPTSTLATHVADLMVAAFPIEVETNEMADLIGPFYDTKGVCAVLGISRQAVSDRRQSRQSLLAMKTSDDEWIHPVFQFSGHEIRPSLRGVLRMLKTIDSWTVGVWLRTSMPSLNGMSPEAWLSAGDDAEVIKRLARHLLQQAA